MLYERLGSSLSIKVLNKSHSIIFFVFDFYHGRIFLFLLRSSLSVHPRDMKRFRIVVDTSRLKLFRFDKSGNFFYISFLVLNQKNKSFPKKFSFPLDSRLELLKARRSEGTARSKTKMHRSKNENLTYK